MLMPTVEVTVEFAFEAAHWLPNVAADHKCRSMHAHSYKVAVTATGPIRNDGMVVDYADIKKVVDPLVASLHHHVLNNVTGLENPTCENLCVWFWTGLLGKFYPTVTVRETDHAYCTYRGPR